MSDSKRVIIFWIEFIFGLLILSFLFGFSIVVIGRGTVSDIPFACLLVFGAFAIFGSIFELIIRLGGFRIEDR